MPISETKKKSICIIKNINIIFIIDGTFSIGTGLELAEVAGPVRWTGLIYNLHRKRWSNGGVSTTSSMSKSVSFS